LDASSSKYGSDKGVTCPIVNYAWLVQYSNQELFGTYSGRQISFTVSSPENLLVTLIVSAPDANPTISPTYTNTSASSAWIQIENIDQQDAAIVQVFTDKGSLGSSNGGVYGPQQLVTAYALVTLNSAPVANKEVAFEVTCPNGTIFSITTAPTNQSGYATWSFRLPWLSSDPQSLFGTWSIVGSVDVSQVVVTGTVDFTFSYTASITGIRTPSTVGRSQVMTVTITVQGALTSSAILSATVYDSQQVPVAFSTANISSLNGGTTTVTMNLSIPSWAFVGTATIYVNILTALPTNGGVPLCPQQTANFQITS